MSKSVKHLVMLAMFTTMALTIFVVEAQIPIPVPIYGVKLGLANVITLIVLVVYRPRDAFAVLVMRILLGSLFTGTLVSMIYSLSGGILCFLGMALLCRLLHRKHLWFISMIGAVLHNVGQIAAAIVVMQSVQVSISRFCWFPAVSRVFSPASLQIVWFTFCPGRFFRKKICPKRKTSSPNKPCKFNWNDVPVIS